MKTLLAALFVFACFFITSAACAGPAEPAESAEAAVSHPAASQFLKFSIDHVGPKKNPVDGTFGFKITKSALNLKDLGASVVEFEVNIGSIDTAIKGRDDHLKSPDFFNIIKFPSAVVQIKDIKAAGEKDNFSANATLSLKGVSKTYPVSFKIVEHLKGGVIIEGTHTMLRTDFGVGEAPKKKGAADEVRISLRLLLENAK